MPRHAFGIFIEEVMDEKHITQIELEHRSGVSDSIISRIVHQGQEPTFIQFAQIVKGLGVKFPYAVQRAGVVFNDDSNEPNADARRLGVVFADDPDMKELADLMSRMSAASRRSVLKMARSILEEPEEDRPEMKTRKPRKKQ